MRQTFSTASRSLDFFDNLLLSFQWRRDILQATQPQGLLVAMFDGHVRTFAPSVSESVFWSAVTPNWGDPNQEE